MTVSELQDQLGIIGAGRMGANMARRLNRAGIDVVVNDHDPAAAKVLADEGVAAAAGSLTDLVGALAAPRAVWIMVPAAFVGSVVDEIAPLLDEGDIVIDGGNSHYPLAIERARQLSASGTFYVDVGTSGGVHGLERGFCLMIGGEDEPVARLDPIFAALAPGVEAANRSPGLSGEPSMAEQGYLHCGPPGAGHFVKMVHNGVEYAVMAAYAEGFALLDRADIGFADQTHDAETTPLADPERFQYRFPIEDVAEVWRRGSVVGSWLLDLTAEALHRNPTLDGFQGHVSDSGEGRWTALAAVETGTPTPTIIDALFSRFSSRGNAEYSNKILSAMRAGFGGHAEASTEDEAGAGAEEAK